MDKEEQLVAILETGDMAHLTVAEALLRGEGIEYVKTNAALQSLLPTNGFTLEPVRLLVRELDEEVALEILKDLTDHPDETEDYDDEAEDEH